MGRPSSSSSSSCDAIADQEVNVGGVVAGAAADGSGGGGTRGGDASYLRCWWTLSAWSGDWRGPRVWCVGGEGRPMGGNDATHTHIGQAGVVALCCPDQILPRPSNPSGRLGPKLGRHLQKLGNFNRVWPCVGQIWPNSAKIWPTLAEFGRSWSKLGATSANTWPKTASFGRIWTGSRLPGQLSNNCWTTLRQMLGNFGACRDRRGYLLGACGEQLTVR